MDFLKDCCMQFGNLLPDSQLKFIPALICGLIVSFIILLVMYRMRTKKPFWICLKNMMNDIFITVPGTNHVEFMKCHTVGCKKCLREDKLWRAIVQRWKDYVKTEEKPLSRVEDAMSNLNKNITSPDPKFKMNLPSNAFWTDFECFEVEKELLKINYKLILEEFLKVFKEFQLGNIEGWTLNHIPNGHWCIYSLIEQGVVVDENCFQLPNTAALLGSFPGLMKDCVFGNAFFSLLYPDSYTESHSGLSNIRLRCHFGLQVIEGCYLEVDGTQAKWKNEQCIIFDDTNEHSEFSAVNESLEKPRVVLVLDFWHPSISKEEKNVLMKVLKPFQE